MKNEETSNSEEIGPHALDRRVKEILGSLFALIAIGTVSFHALEDWTWIQSVYFTVATITTVGYGDLAPTTDISRIFTTVYIIAGVGLAAASIGTLGSQYMRRSEELFSRRFNRKSPKAKTEESTK